MPFSEIAGLLGILEYPEKMDDIYAEGAGVLFDRALIDRHHRERELYGEYYDDVVAGYEDLIQKEAAYTYALVAARYLLSATREQATKIPLPEPDGSPALDMLPLFVLLPMVDKGLAEFKKRGVSPETAEEYMKVFRGDIRVNIRRHGRPGIDKLYFNWITLYIYGLIFPCGGFKFNLGTIGRFFYVLKNKHTGQVAVLLHDRDVHRSGELLGSAGLQDAQGAFHTQVTETEDAWTGYPTNRRGRILPELHRYPKTDWVLAVQPGDCVLAIHLPGGMRLEKEATRQAIRDAFAHAKKYYADYAPKALHCGSWLLNPELGDVLGEDSNIAAFGSLFHLHPTKCAGQSVFNFVFKTGVNPDLATLPEDTRLQRYLKAKYLAGDYHRNFGGFILPEDV